jgi:transposase-like protein
VTKKRRSFTPDFKFQIVLELLTGEKTAAQLCREHRISETSLSRWRQQFLEQGASVFGRKDESSAEQERIAELERMIGRLTMELTAAHVSWRSVPGKKALNWLDSLR